VFALCPVSSLVAIAAVLVCVYSDVYYLPHYAMLSKTAVGTRVRACPVPLRCGLRTVANDADVFPRDHLGVRD